MNAPSDGSPVTRPPPLYALPDPALNISGASRRLRALAVLSGSLTDALDPAAAAILVEQKALSALDATSAVVVTLGTFPPATPEQDTAHAAEALQVLHVVHAIGLPAELITMLEALPLGAPVPLAEVARSGEAVFLHSPADMERYPAWGATMVASGARAAAIVPVWANGELRGVLGLTWAAPRVFDEDECAFVLTLGTMCAQAIMRAHLRAAEKKAREGAEAARELAEEANRSKAHFVATISHELRTPMNAVMGYTALLVDEMDGPVNDRQKEHLGRVRDTSKHLMGLIEDLLGFARIEAGEELVRAEVVQLRDIVEQTLVLIRPLAETKRLQILVEGPARPFELFTDSRKLRQILVNLLANAVKFTDTGHVRILFRIEDQHPPAMVFFEVSDTGVGMTTSEQSHSFDPFWQGDPSAKHGASTGLGLSVARQLARLLGGDLYITRSAVSQGSTFVLSMPARYLAPVTGYPLPVAP